MKLAIENISVVLPGMPKPVVHDFSVSLEGPQMVAVMGLNGSGKTTLLKTLSGLLKPLAGQILLDGQSLSSLDARSRARLISVVPQDFPGQFGFTVLDFVLMGRFAWQEAKFVGSKDYEEARHVLAQLDLTDLADRPLHALSGGERQRVLLAQALAQGAPIMLLDEPVNHLDIKQRTVFLELLQKFVRDEGKMVIAVMHQLEDVRRFFSHVVLMRDGQMLVYGPVADNLGPERVAAVF